MWKLTLMSSRGLLTTSVVVEAVSPCVSPEEAEESSEVTGGGGAASWKRWWAIATG